MLLQYETQRLVLKVLGPDYSWDVLRFYERDKELFEKYEADRVQNFYTEGYQRAMLQLEYGLCLKFSHIRFYVFRKEDPATIIGTVCLYDISKAYSRADVGYKFNSQFHHMGYASEAVEKLIDIAFTEIKLHRLCARAVADNTPSIRLLKGLGFEQEGICRDYMRFKGVWTDHLQFSLLAPESCV